MTPRDHTAPMRNRALRDWLNWAWHDYAVTAILACVALAIYMGAL